jgi:hypothetical protein
VRKTDCVLGALDHVRGECRLEHLVGDPGAKEQLRGWTAHRRCQQQRSPCCGRKVVET